MFFIPCSSPTKPVVRREAPRALLRPQRRRSLLLACGVALSAFSAHAAELVGFGVDQNGVISQRPTGTDFVAAIARGFNGYALRSNGTVVAWGANYAGQVSGAPSGTGFVAIAAGAEFALALRADGRIVAWGSNSAGQISSAPSELGFVAIAAGGEHAYALRSDGSIAAWGADWANQVSAAPTTTGFTTISAGDGHGVALRADGSIAAWGWNHARQVSDRPRSAGFVALACGLNHSYALRVDGTIAAWGGNGLLQVSNTPTEAGFRAIGAGSFHGHAIRADGSLAAWGEASAGAVLGLPTGAGFVQVSAGRDFGLALRGLTGDECTSAIPLQLGANGPFDTAVATSSREPFACETPKGGDLWFSYTPSSCAALRFETCTPALQLDTVLEIFEGSCAQLALLVCDDDGCGSGSRATVPLAAPGVSYLVRVAGKSFGAGTFELVVSELAGVGEITTTPTGCGGLGLQVASGAPRLGSSIGFELTSSSGFASLFLGFAPLALPLCASCTLGTTLDIVLSGLALPPLAIPCDPLLVGGRIYVQGIDLGSLGGCAAPLPLRLSDTLRVTIG
ncbi:MAG: hypothetical protein IPN34_15010 [Planctomycetes bacterium]|nr:hypothetical protein [Planctomycetota bacterium]